MIDKAGNPAWFWVNGSTQEDFTFVPGNKLYFVAIQDNGWIPVSLLVFADNEDHVRTILKEMCEFRLQCEAKYEEYATNLDYPTVDHTFGVGLTEDVLQLVTGSVISDRHKLTLLIKEQPTNHVFKVGWGDTVL